jgi:alpha-tubulin suppressor-like RCC1 family protein
MFMRKNYITFFFTLAVWLSSPCLLTAQTIAGGEAHMLLLCNNETSLRYSGGNQKNQFNPVNKFSNFFVSLPQGVTIKQIASGWNHVLFLLSNGKVWSMGDNFYGQLGDGTRTSRSSPVEVMGINNAVSVGAGSACSYFVLADGTVKVAGNNGFGQLGISTLNITYTQQPMTMVDMNNAVKVDGGYKHAIILDRDGNVWGVGEGLYGQLGDSTIMGAVKPHLISGISQVKDIAVNGYHSLFLKTDGTVWAAGNNQYGQLGDSSTIHRKQIFPIPGLSNVIDIAAGESHSLFVKADGTAWACGINNFGQLGTGDFTDYNYPVKVPGLFSIAAVGAGFNQSFFLQSPGVLYACGFNSSGQLGIGSYTDAPSPIRIQGLQCIIGTEINEADENRNLFSVFPVPVRDEVLLQLESSGPYDITLSDCLGKILLQVRLTVTEDEKKVPLPVSQINSGLYYVTIRDEQNRLSTRRVIKP